MAATFRAKGRARGTKGSPGPAFPGVHVLESGVKNPAPGTGAGDLTPHEGL
ncbi:MAG: hypothetical protein LBF40_10200 [Deltaproteobacteria bacterium]|jgi:hypothetical protein|nr:hypothetical protein [Deltaproteobacteria bacterium]